MQEPGNNKNDGALGSDDSLIQPTGFTPVDAKTVARRPWIKPVSVVFALVLLVLIVLLWYVFSARSVFIAISPVTQNMEIQGGLNIKMGERYLMRPGEFRLIANLPGYHPLNQSFTVTKSQNQNFDFEFKLLPGLLSVTTIPENAQVSIDNEPVGKAPIEGLSVEPGARRVSVSADRYLPQQHQIDIEGKQIKQALEVELTPAWSEYSLSSLPQGADVLVNGKVLGQTPVTLELLQGEYEIALALDGYKGWTEQFAVAANSLRVLPEIKLQQLDGAARILSTPNEASITVDGKFRGRTPKTIALKPGRSHQVSLFKPGYQVSKRSLKIKSGTTEQISIKLKPVVAQVKVLSQPGNAKVYVNGKYVGLGNQTFSLPTQKQKVELKLDGYVTHQTYVTPRVGLEQEVKVRLKTLKQAKWEVIKRVVTTSTNTKLKLFRPGPITMGASRREAGRRANESLVKVNLTRAFYLATKEVTNEQYRLYKEKHSSGNVQGHSLDGDTQPVVKLSWEDAALYCNWLSEKDGLPLAYEVESGKVVGINAASTGYRLPTEAEWAWAARHTRNGLLKYPWGAALPPAENSGNYADRSAAFVIGRIVTQYNDKYVVTAPVGSFALNSKGLYDMGGNVSEWVHDFYASKAGISKSAKVDPTGPEKGKYHVIRGSSWAHGSVTQLRLSYRDYGDSGRNDVGFRIARYVE